ncbi:MAG: LPS export ABC transporter periplasmic protein LptC, partial [Thermodesulfobacteriota bacterium]
ADLSGSVVIENQGHRICTEALHYEDNRHILYSNVPVAVIGESLHFTADSMTFDLATGRAVLAGNVTGSITDTSMTVR